MDATWDREQDLQRRVLTAVFRDEPVDSETVLAWRRERDDIEERVLNGDSTEMRQILDARITTLQGRLDGLEDGEFSIFSELGSNRLEALSLEALCIGETLRWLRLVAGCHLQTRLETKTPRGMGD